MPQKSYKTGSRSTSLQNNTRKKQPAWKQVLLALSLVPLIGGGLLILLWGIDVIILQPEDTQVTVGVLFILLSFTVSNLVQGNWISAAGWFLLMVADAVLLSSLRGPTQIVAIIIGIVAFVLFAIEIFRRLRSSQKSH